MDPTGGTPARRGAPHDKDRNSSEMPVKTAGLKPEYHEWTSSPIAPVGIKAGLSRVPHTARGHGRERGLTRRRVWVLAYQVGLRTENERKVQIGRGVVQDGPAFRF